MLIPESRRTRDLADQMEPESPPGSSVARRSPETTPTVMRGSGSSVRKLQAVGPSTIPLPSPGEMVGTFRLEEAIGAGGMGAVYRATDIQLDRQVALKLLPPDQASDAEVVLRFYQEGRSAAQLDHENIARVFSIGQDGLLHYIAFEFIEGETLRQRVERSGPLDSGSAVDVSLQIAGALVHASRRGVVHRDIKPSNIILTPQGRAKLVDMGLARRFERGGDAGLTQTGMTLGTFDYISPEQARDPRDVDVRSDLYSLGCTMFHMLTGRPPFPGGTVLQKLIQHQEEAPADVRTLNPEVPAGLSAIIAKLMAKERERRYQGPEHLVRDLMSMAGALGIEPTASGLEGWMLRPHHPWWERHLAWALPAAGFLAVIAGLAWFGRELSRPPTSGRGSTGAPVSRPADDRKIAVPAAPEIRPVPARSEGATAGPAAVAEYPRTIPVGPSDMLDDVVASAPRGSVIVLSESGPYLVSGRSAGGSGGSIEAKDLTIRAEAGARPIVRASARGLDSAAETLLQFGRGHVTIERVEFQLDGTPEGLSLCAIRAEDTELTLRGCSFRRPARRGSGEIDGDLAAIDVRTSRPAPGVYDRPSGLLADACHFDEGMTAVRTRGPADVTLRDCTLAPASPSFWFESAGTDRALPAELRLIHTTIMAGAGPVLRIEGGPVRVRVDDSAIAAGGTGTSTLVEVDDPRDLNWRGRSNLYGGIGPFLATPPKSPRPSRVADFAAWEQGTTEPRELGSRLADRSIWEAADSIAALHQDREDPTRAFHLDARAAIESGIGARQGPFGPIRSEVRLAQNDATHSVPTLMEVPRPSMPESPSSRGPSTNEMPMPRSSTAAESTELPPMPTASGSTAPTEAEIDPEGFGQPMPMPMPMPPPTEPIRDEPRSEPRKDAGAASRSGAEATAERGEAVRSVEEFLAAVRAMEDRGGTIRIAAGGDLELPAVAISSSGSKRIRIAAEAGGGVRPRLRFVPSAASPSEWLAMLTLRSGSLQIEGLDLVVPEPEAVASDRIAAIAVQPGTELILDDCTVTVSARGAAAAALVVRPGPSSAASGAAARANANAEAVIVVRNGFLRSGGDALAIAGGGRLSLNVEETLIAAEGSLLDAMGSARKPAETDKAELRVRIDRVSARLKGGLVHLQTTRDEPHMSAVQFDADRSIVSTVTGDHPLFRLEGQDNVERLRDKIRWSGRHIAYHRIKTYRRDEIVQSGALPKIYDRDDWTRAFEPTDDAPMLADLEFRQEADATVPAWRVVRNELALAGRSPAEPLGPDAGKVPEPPPAEEEL